RQGRVDPEQVRQGEVVRRGSVGVDDRGHVVAAEEVGLRPRGREDVEPRRAALALARARERERRGRERLAGQSGDVPEGAGVRRRRAVLLEMEHAVAEARLRTAGVVRIEDAWDERGSGRAGRTVVERLPRGPATVGEASRGLAVSKPAVTKHLKVLEDAGVVARTVTGRTHVLRLRPRALRDATQWLDLHRALWEAKFDAIEEHFAKEETA